MQEIRLNALPPIQFALEHEIRVDVIKLLIDTDGKVSAKEFIFINIIYYWLLETEY